jgi:hypothetical protein
MILAIYDWEIFPTPTLTCTCLQLMGRNLVEATPFDR